MTDFSVNLVLNQSTSSPQQYSRSKDQDAAEDREEPCAGATGMGELGAGCITILEKFYLIIGIINNDCTALIIFDCDYLDRFPL